MPAAEEEVSISKKTWHLDDGAAVDEFADDMAELGFVSSVHRHPDHPGNAQRQIEVVLPDKPRNPILAELTDKVVMVGGNVASLEKLTAQEYEAKWGS